MVYARTLGRTTYTFQVSGRLWRNSLIMEDRETGTSWSQVAGRAIYGKHRGTQLERFEAIETSWQQWYAAHPDTTLLKKSEEVLGSHYQRYFDDPERLGLFRAQWLADRMPGKTLVYGANIGAHALAVTEGALDRTEIVQGELGGAPIVVSRGRDSGVRAFVTRVGTDEIKLSRDAESGEVRDVGGSIWDLGSGRCISGPRTGARLETVAITPVYWFAWSGFYPNTQVID